MYSIAENVRLVIALLKEHGINQLVLSPGGTNAAFVRGVQDDPFFRCFSVVEGKGDELANEIFRFTGKMLGEACADFAAFSSPEAFIFFGGLIKAGDLIMNPIKEAYDSHVMPIFKGKAKFLVSGLDGAGAAVLGASALGWDI